MAKPNHPKGTGTSRIRFIMLDAEIPEGDLSEITAAIQNALKPAAIVQVKQAAPIAQLAAAPSDEESDSGTTGGFDEAEVIAQTGSAREPRLPRSRKPSNPKVIDLDLASDVSLEAYIADYPPKSEADRNLVCAAFFKECRGLDTITMHHIYTCYRAMKWPSGMDDFGGPLRYLKSEQLLSSPAKAQHAINHIGLARVHKLKKD